MRRSVVIGLVVLVALAAALGRSGPGEPHADRAAAPAVASVATTTSTGAAQLAVAASGDPELVSTTVDEAITLLPVPTGARVLSPPQTARGGWTVETELCFEGRDASAVAGEVQRTLTAAGFSGVTSGAAPGRSDHYRIRARRETSEREQVAVYAFVATRDLPECAGAEGAVWAQLGLHKSSR